LIIEYQDAVILMGIDSSIVPAGAKAGRFKGIRSGGSMRLGRRFQLFIMGLRWVARFVFVLIVH